MEEPLPALTPEERRERARFVRSRKLKEWGKGPKDHPCNLWQTRKIAYPAKPETSAAYYRSYAEYLRKQSAKFQKSPIGREQRRVRYKKNRFKILSEQRDYVLRALTKDPQGFKARRAAAVQRCIGKTKSDLKRHHSDWTKDEDAALLNPDYSPRYLAEMLGRSYKSVVTRRYRLKLKLTL